MMPSSARPGDEDGSKYHEEEEEERYDHGRGELLGNQPSLPTPISWDFEINILGVKDDTPIHFCDKCELPIKIYGRMIPCKHVLCYGCAVLPKDGAAKMCPGCNVRVRRVDRYMQGSLFMCTTVQGCKRTYLSQRDLQAHINHSHLRTVTSDTPAPNKDVHPPIGPPPAEIPDGFTVPLDNHQASHIQPEQYIRMSPAPVQRALRNHSNLLLDGTGAPSVELAMPAPPPPPSPHWGGQESFQFSTRKPSNLVPVPIWNNANSGTEDRPPPVPVFPHHYTDNQGQLGISYPYEIRPPWLYYGPPPLPAPPPALPVIHLMQHPSQAEATSLVYSQAPLPPGTSVLPLPRNIIVQMLPNVNYLPPGLPPPSQYGGLPVNVPGPYHNYPDFWRQFTENQGTLIPQPDGLRPGMGPEPRRLPAPYPPTPGMQDLPEGPHRTDQERYDPYSQ